MNLTCIITLISYLVLIHADTINNSIEGIKSGENEKEKTWLVPENDGSFRLVNSSESELIRGMVLSNLKVLEVTFQLFTKSGSNNGVIIPLNDARTLSNSDFNLNNPTRIITHGWESSGYSKMSYLVRDAYFQRGDFNIFVVNWSSVAQSKNYMSVKNKVPVVGKIVAQFIDFLHTSGRMQFNTLSLIGHSLGAHVSGYAGKLVTKGRINTIIGLDPASPLFSINSSQTRLSENGAEYVETIHTCGEKLGFFKPIGTSFYPNWGKSQPGCGWDVTGKCSHSRSYELFAQSISTNNHFTAIGCNSFDEIVQKKCSRPTNVRMGGEPSNYGKANGIFYVYTNSKAPF